MQWSKLLLVGAFALLLGACGKEVTVTMDEFQNDMIRISNPAVPESEAKTIADKYRGDFKVTQGDQTVTKAEMEAQAGGRSFNELLDLLLRARSATVTP